MWKSCVFNAVLAEIQLQFLDFVLKPRALLKDESPLLVRAFRPASLVWQLGDLLKKLCENHIVQLLHGRIAFVRKTSILCTHACELGTDCLHL